MLAARRPPSSRPLANVWAVHSAAAHPSTQLPCFRVPHPPCPPPSSCCSSPRRHGACCTRRGGQRGKGSLGLLGRPDGRFPERDGVQTTSSRPFAGASVARVRTDTRARHRQLETHTVGGGGARWLLSPAGAVMSSATADSRAAAPRGGSAELCRDPSSKGGADPGRSRGGGARSPAASQQLLPATRGVHHSEDVSRRVSTGNRRRGLAPTIPVMTGW